MVALPEIVVTPGGQSDTPAQQPSNQIAPTIAPATGLQDFFGGNQSSGGVLRYPLDNYKYVMSFSISKYQRDNLSSVGAFIDAGYPGIVLPMPSNMVDNNHVEWQEIQLGFLPGLLVNGLLGNTQNTARAAAALGGVAGLAAGAGVALGGPAGVFGRAVAGAGSGVLSAAAPIVGGAVQGASIVGGIAPNQFVTMLMKGPTYKRHRFEWILSPNNQQEAYFLQAIITTFKNAMSVGFYNQPEFTSAPVLWAYPKIFRIRFYPNSDWLYKFKPCVLDSFAVNYAPTGRATFNVDNTGGGSQNAPESVQIQASFIELEYWLENDFTPDGSNNPDLVNQASAQGTSGEVLTNFLNKIGQIVSTLASSNPNLTPNLSQGAP